MENQQATIDWFLGLLDGEGCFISKNKYGNNNSPYIRISNTQKDIIDYCESFLKRNCIICFVTSSAPKNKNKHNRVYELNIGGVNNCYTFYKLVKDRYLARINQLEEVVGASTLTRAATLSVDWAAGLMEGECCFTINTQYHKGNHLSHNPAVILENTNNEIINQYIKVLYSLGLPWYIQNRVFKNPNWKPSKVIKIEGFMRVIRLLRAFEGKWISKKTIRKTNLLKEFCESRLKGKQKDPYTSREHQLAFEIKSKI